jgi:hypothetical protein
VWAFYLPALLALAASGPTPFRAALPSAGAVTHLPSVDTPPP